MRPSDEHNADAGATIVIPCYNAEAWIDRTVTCALAQAPAVREVILVDDGSTDGSVAAAQRHADQIRIATGPNRGACHARNRGLALVRTRYVKFLDADDALEGDIVAGEIAAAEATGADLALSAMARIREGAAPRVTAPPAAGAPATAIYASWLHGASVNPSAQLWRVDALRRVGGWNEAVLLNQDGELVMRALLRGIRIASNARGRAIYHVSAAGSLSKTKSDAKIASHAAFLGDLLAEARGTPFEAESEALRRSLYGLARMAMRLGAVDAGRQALAILAREGGVRHYGGAAHRLAASMLGLETKVRLWGS